MKSDEFFTGGIEYEKSLSNLALLLLFSAYFANIIILFQYVCNALRS